MRLWGISFTSLGLVFSPSWRTKILPNSPSTRRGTNAHHAISNIYILFHNSRRTSATRVSRQENVVRDAHSRVDDVIIVPIKHDGVSVDQNDDDKLRTLLDRKTTLQLENNPNLRYLRTAVLRHLLCQTTTVRPVSSPPSDIKLPTFSHTLRK
jgi:hypothetical protein